MHNTQHFAYRSGEGEAALLCVGVAGLMLVLPAGDLVFEPLFEFFLVVTCCFADLIWTKKKNFFFHIFI